MTEATGGITMTPPWQYVDDTNRLPLPGVQTRLSSRGELVELKMGSFRIRIPRWIYRELGILEDDIGTTDSGLFNQAGRRHLPLKPAMEPNTFLIGDLEYRVSNGILDMGIFARQPRLWIGNPFLIRFLPCREDWDTQLGAISSQVLRPWKVDWEYHQNVMPKLPQIKERMLIKNNDLITKAIFGDDEQAIEAVNDIAKMLNKSDLRWNEIFRRRLEALSRHTHERIRSLSYQILLLDEPSPDYAKVFPAFVSSGLSFADNESMEVIATRFEKYQMEALRRRMLTYRSKLRWPADEATIKQFENLFLLMLNFVDAHPNLYFPYGRKWPHGAFTKPNPDLQRPRVGFCSISIDALRLSCPGRP